MDPISKRRPDRSVVAIADRQAKRATTYFKLIISFFETEKLKPTYRTLPIQGRDSRPGS